MWDSVVSELILTWTISKQLLGSRHWICLRIMHGIRLVLNLNLLHHLLKSDILCSSNTPMLIKQRMQSIAFVASLMAQATNLVWLSRDIPWWRLRWQMHGFYLHQLGESWGRAAEGSTSTSGLFWWAFLSCPQAALASSPRVCRTLTVIFLDSSVAMKANTCQRHKAMVDSDAWSIILVWTCCSSS